MANPLLGLMKDSANTGSRPDIAAQFREFRQNFKGDPNKAINDMLRRGQITQQQLESAKLLASLVAKK